ncbi:hypothetical protein [Leptospira adleri]|uniref:hypothetical protein n=1 Tax=Leptospira adleri TaxID=2023186 RepID=UPI001082FFA8|nr:hypothetical protein [Leptospira adleri]TGM58671.1 hypothetical protein EHQ97_06160 [Leptospira adleri]
MKTFLIIATFVIIVLSWMGITGYVYCFDPTKLDRMNALYTLYTGLGFWGLVVTIFIQIDHHKQNTKMNAISALLNSSEFTIKILANSAKLKDYPLKPDEITKRNVELYDELLKMISK